MKENTMTSASPISTAPYDTRLDDIQYYLDEARKCRVVEMQTMNLKKAAAALNALIADKRDA